MQDITCGIKTLMRPSVIARLLDSIYKFFPDMKCVVVDDSKQPTLDVSNPHWKKIKYIKLPFDTGLGQARNVMIDAVETKYCVYLDDDFIFVPNTNLELMRAILEEDKADLVAGKVLEGRKTRLYHGLLEVKGDTLFYKRRAHKQATFVMNGHKHPLAYVDVALNFFMGRTEMLQDVKWDADLKINTHTEFFFRAKDKMQIVYCPDTAIRHKPGGSRNYKKLRHRKFKMKGLAKHGIKRVKHVGGRWK